MFFKTVINKGVVNKVLYSKIGKGKEVNEGKDRKRKESSKPIQDYINPIQSNFLELCTTPICLGGLLITSQIILKTQALNS